MAASAPGGGELRRNPVNGKLTIIAPERATRPTDLHGKGSAGVPGPCPFCAGNEALTPPEIDAIRAPGSAPDGPGWRVRVVPNKYPALKGGHEVIVHSPNHCAELEDLGDEALLEVLEVWRRRIAAQLESGAVAATLIVNHGAGAGASLAHPHAQLFATPVVPPLLLDEIREFDRHRERYGGGRY
jgi:UDPglucose--hexose-1-phosphate uridylyltransferase